MSPARQRKAYNWHSGGSGRVAHKNSLSPQRSGYHSDGHNSNMSSDNEDLSIRSESFAGRGQYFLTFATTQEPSSLITGNLYAIVCLANNYI